MDMQNCLIFFHKIRNEHVTETLLKRDQIKGHKDAAMTLLILHLFLHQTFAKTDATHI